MFLVESCLNLEDKSYRFASLELSFIFKSTQFSKSQSETDKEVFLIKYTPIP